MNSLKLAVQFGMYYLRAINRHSLQAPFAYSLNEVVFKRDKKSLDQQPIEALRARLKSNQTCIKVRDFGAGFAGTVYKELPISFIAKNSAKPPRYARMLYRLVRYLKPATIVELGTSVGISALYQAAGNPDAKIITLEGCPGTATIARENFKQFPDFNIQLIEGAFEETLPDVLNNIGQIDFLFIDGHHQMEPTLHYIQLCFPKLSNEAVVVVDDINWSDEMRETWRRLVADNRFSLSLDIFMMGILFLSKDLSKENFVLRY